MRQQIVYLMQFCKRKTVFVNHHHIIYLSQADNFFVPPLNLLSEKMRLSPSIAGITLLAIGNGAPDVFTAYAGLKQDEIELVLG